MSMIRKTVAAVAAVGLLVTAVPGALAQEPFGERQVTMSIPLMENHTVWFKAHATCVAGANPY